MDDEILAGLTSVHCMRLDESCSLKTLGSVTTMPMCFEEYLIAFKDHIMNLHWVPEQSAILGNEEADDCAGRGSEIGLREAVYTAKSGLHFLSAQVEKMAGAARNSRWTYLCTCFLSTSLWLLLKLQENLGGLKTCKDIHTLICTFSFFVTKIKKK